MSKLVLTTDGERHIVIARRFAAAPNLVYRAHTEPMLIQKWMLGPHGWTMPTCDCDARPGGTFRFEWTNPKLGSFHVTGEFIAVEPFNRIEHVERMFLPEQTPDNHVVTHFAADGNGTLMTVRMTLPDAATRAKMLATGMEHGLEASYARLEIIM